MRIFFLSVCLALLLVVRCDDAAAADKASAKANDASAAAKATADAAKDTSGAAKDAAGAAEKAADAAKDASKSAEKASDAAKDAAKSASDTSGAAKEASDAAVEVTKVGDKCVIHKPRTHYPTFRYKFHRSPPTKEEIEAEHKIMKKNPAIHSALSIAKELRKEYHTEKKATEKLKAEGKAIIERNHGYLKTRDAVKFKHNTEECHLLHGFRHLHIPFVKCKPEGDDGKCKGETETERQMNVPSEYNTYTLYCHLPKHKDARKFEIRVASKCGCKTLACQKGE